MTTEQAKAIFTAAIEKETNADRIAKLELLREYFTNPTFRKTMEDHTFENQK